MTRTTLSFAAAAALLSTAAFAQTGFFDFGRIPGLSAQPSVQIDLNPAMLGFVSEAAKTTDPEAAEVLAGIEGVRVYVYDDVGDDGAAVLRFIDDTSSKLESEGWHRTVFIQDGDEKVRLYVKLAEPGAAAPSSVAGLTVMISGGEGGEAVFINVAGSIQPAQLGRVAAAFGVEGVLGGLGGLAGPRDTTP
jgi:hypothetical protein